MSARKELRMLRAELDEWFRHGRTDALAWKDEERILSLMFSKYGRWAYSAGYREGEKERSRIEERRAKRLAATLKCLLCSELFTDAPAYLAHPCCQHGRPE